MTRVIRGSAIQTEDYGFIFTPYNTNPPENSPWSILAVTPNGKLQCTAEVAQMRITVPKAKTVAALQNILTREFAKLISNINETKLWEAVVR